MVFVNVGINTVIEAGARLCAQESLNILLKYRLVNNEDCARMMAELGCNNTLEVECFEAMLCRVP
jgi:hypothetical protein